MATIYAVELDEPQFEIRSRPLQLNPTAYVSPNLSRVLIHVHLNLHIGLADKPRHLAFRHIA
jgi:hypothetical protein